MATKIPFGMIKLGTGKVVTLQEWKEMAAAWGVERAKRPPLTLASPES